MIDKKATEERLNKLFPKPSKEETELMEKLGAEMEAEIRKMKDQG